MPSNARRPPYDPEVAAMLAALSGSELLAPLTLDRIQPIRDLEAASPEDISRFNVHREDRKIPGYQGDLIDLSLFTHPDRPQPVTPRPAVITIHGGGMVYGNRLAGLGLALPWVETHDALVASMDYRLAPEHPAPYQVEDCYATLVWLDENAEELGIDRDRILVIGGSAGGGLAAGVALIARDRGGPHLAGQMLLCPMLDDRNNTISARQYRHGGVWDQTSNQVGWDALLGDRRAQGEISEYVAPTRATDLSDLAPAYIDVASAEIFRDETVAYASQIWADGGVAELHVWPGGTHGWENLVPNSPLARLASTARESWVERILAR